MDNNPLERHITQIEAESKPARYNTEAELARIRQDIIYLTGQAIRTDDLAALKRLQTSITRWIRNNTPEEGTE